ncbi:ABC transporter ATP-binding protein [Azospirillum rugosum]|uniref:Simple sugar transport system ATP-binding protein n=1 Tax=Azospirillum rugosum TaxID=416170 RepID=A0ABS4SNT0_9PROT|nr:ABC transporter ATP-binding protein [Azospirillum rugosum]MBP2293587.1 simple sugar transport system ATP-binding protein [Azospirillum rugosum]MDQ0529266.1 simple sugar transport system ATP-binding protein [Azospirillum rugosum]
MPDAPTAAATLTPPALETRGVNKWFGANHANRDVSLAVPKGTIHGVIGENGAGKSTIMSIVYGYLPADSGEILVDGRPVAVKSPRDALAAGVGMVHQHFMLVDPFTVLENVLLGAEGGVTLAAGMERARAELVRLARDYGLEVDLDRPVGELPVGAQQRVEILKALYRGADILILDEPTGVLTPQETDHLFRILRALREQGKTIVIITHKLREIMELTDNVTVMRRGEVVANVRTAETSKEQLAELMVGRKVLLRVEKAPAQPGPVVLEVSGLTLRDRSGVERVKGVGFSVRAGEIVGIAGVSGNGQSELLEALAGMRPVAGGSVRLRGEELADRPGLFNAKALRGLRVGHVPEDRQKVGLITSFEARENAILGHHDDQAYNGRVLMDRAAVLSRCEAEMEAYDVRPRDARLRAANFSGGNQQKIVLAREIERNPDLLLVGQPTRGVDIGAIEFIHKRLVRLRDEGKAILLVSVELDEIVSLSDRILVMFDGRLMGEVAPNDAALEQIERRLGLMMAGVEAAA